jgi:hypothetical protein
VAAPKKSSTPKRSKTIFRPFIACGRRVPAWVTGMAFVSAELGALEVVGMGASGARCGIATSHFDWIGAIPAIGGKGGYLAAALFGHALKTYPRELSMGFWTAICSFSACTAVTLAVTFVTRPRPDAELAGLVYSLTPKPDEGSLARWRRPAVLAAFVLVLTVLLNLIFF